MNDVNGLLKTPFVCNNCAKCSWWRSACCWCSCQTEKTAMKR